MYPKAEVLLVFIYGTIAEIFDVGGKFFAIVFFFFFLNSVCLEAKYQKHPRSTWTLDHDPYVFLF